MAKQTINTGLQANDGTGDKPRTAFTKTNQNFTEVYDKLDLVETGLEGKADEVHSHNAATTSEAGFMSTADKTKLNGIAVGAQVNTVTSVASKTGAVTLVKGDVGLGSVDNTSDAAKPISSATQTALNGKANTVHVHDDATASTSGFMSGAEKTKLNGIAAGAQVNTVTSVAGKTGAISLVKGDVGLGSVDNTSDAAKPISSATQTALNEKVDKSGGHDLTGGFKANAATALTGANITPNPLTNNFFTYSNGAAFTLTAPSATGGYTMVITVTNSGTAGALTASGFNKVDGLNSFNTSSGALFNLFITVNGGVKTLSVSPAS